MVRILHFKDGGADWDEFLGTVNMVDTEERKFAVIGVWPTGADLGEGVGEVGF